MTKDETREFKVEEIVVWEHTKADIFGFIIVEIYIQIVLKSAESVMRRKYVKDEMKRKERGWLWESGRCLIQ